MANPHPPQPSDPQPRDPHASNGRSPVDAAGQPFAAAHGSGLGLDSIASVATSMVGSLPVAIALVDATGTYQAASQRWAEALHLATVPQAGDSLAATVPMLAALWRPAIVLASHGQRVKSDQAQWLDLGNAQGEWLEWEVAPWDGLPTGWVAISLQVVTERLTTEQAWKQLFLQAGTCLCTIDPQGHFQFLNDTWDSVVGWREEAIGRPFTDYVHPDDRSRTLAEWHFSPHGTPTRVLENRYRRKDGTYRWFRWHFFWDTQADVSYAIAHDITERRVLRLAQEQADTALRDNNERFRTMVANVPGVIYRCLGDRDRSVLFASEAIETLTGYRAESFVQYRNRTLQELTHPDDREAIWVEIQSAIQQQRPYHLEYRLAHANGELRWVAEQGQPAFNHDHQLMWLDGVIFDVTDRKATEQALHASKNRWLSLVQRIPVAIVEWRLDGRVLTWNAAATELFGYTFEDMVGQPFDRILPDNERPKVYGVVADLLAGRGGLTCQNYNQTRDGRLILCEWQNTPLRNDEGDVIACLSIATDITARIFAENRLRQSEERYRCLVEAISQVIWNTDANGAVKEPMPYWGAFTGQSFEDYREQGWLEAIHPDDRAHTATTWQAAFAAKRPYKTEHRVRRFDGEYRYMVVRGVPVLEANGSVREWMGVDTDITERKEAENRLIEQERTLRTIIDAAPILIWLTDVNGRVRLANETLCQTFGVQESTLLAADHYQDVLGVDTCQTCLQSDALCLERGHTIQVEERFPSPTGEIRDFDVIKTPLRDRAGGITGLLLVAIDTTDRKRIEREQKRLLSILEATTDFVGMTDVNGNLTYVNPAGCAMLGYDPQDIRQLNMAQVLHSSEHGWMAEQLTTLLKQGVWQGEGTFCDRAGNPIPVSQVALVHYGRDGEIEYLSNVARNITGIKRVEQELRDSKLCLQRQVERERLINTLSTEIRKNLHGSKQAVVQFALEEIRMALGVDRATFSLYDEPTTDPVTGVQDGTWTVLAEAKAPELVSIAGAYPESWFGNVLSCLNRMEILQLDDVNQLSDPAEQAIFHQLQIRSMLVVPVRIYGSRIAAVSCIQPTEPHPWHADEIALVQAVGNQVAIAKNQADLFERTEASAAEAHAKAIALEHALQELQLTQAKLVQQEKMSSLGQLVAGVAHEINNPVNFIYGNLAHADDYSKDLLKLVRLYRQTHPQSNPEVEDLIDEIDLDFLIEDLPKMLDSMKLGAERIKEIVQSLRIFSRMDEAEMKVVNIHEGIDSTLTILNGRMKPKNSRLGIEIIREYGDLPQVECYAGQLNQVFMNILSNAIDTLEERDQQRSIAEMKANPSQIRIATERRSGDRAAIRISDNGLGIPAEVQQRLFDPFYTTKPVGKGTGLGLSISYQIITEKHGGTLTCTSAPGEGSTFEIVIPLWQPEAPS
ncbi:MAG TPA: PAS domain S-box protein [Coleofasciculaceae cyanobacterium]